VKYVGDVACMREGEMNGVYWWGKLIVENHVDDSGLVVGIILYRML
jgi:hypothetical protein